jgi:hypothetical protein
MALAPGCRLSRNRAAAFGGGGVRIGMDCKASFLADSPAIGKKSQAADRPGPRDHRPQKIMQRGAATTN